MVPDLIWVPHFFGPEKEIWALRNLGPKKFGPRIKIIILQFHQGTKFLEDQLSWGQNILGSKFLRAQMRWGTISLIAG